jgi:glycosyltransferase involved in cell wall biosynthesis
MRIGFLGNANNYPFILARALRRLGHEILFIVGNLTLLDRPENLYADVRPPYPEWIRDLSPMRERDVLLRTMRNRKTLTLLRDCDAVVLNQLGPALLPAIRRPAIIILTGSDLEYYADFGNIDSLVAGIRGPVRLPRRLFGRYVAHKLIAAQRSGIKSACAINYFARGLNPPGDALLDEIKVQDKRFFFMMTDLGRIQSAAPPKNRVIRVFCGTRLSWSKPMITGASELDYKGSDVMIRGLGTFVRDKGIPLDIRLVKKGIHVSETRQLARHEGLGNYVTWLEEMSQDEVITEFKLADIVFEQLGKSPLGMAGLDAMAVGRPVIANSHPEILDKAMGAVSPICQARTPEEVSAQLSSLVLDQAERERVGHASREYVEKFFSPDRAANMCLDRLKECISEPG